MLYKNVDGTNRIIGKNEYCLCPTSRAFWKFIEDIPTGIKTRSKSKRQKFVNRRAFETYFEQKNETVLSAIAHNDNMLRVRNKRNDKM